MADAPGVSKSAVACVLLSVVSLFLWLVTLPALASLASSDAAGNAMSQAFTALALIALFVLLALLLIISGLGGKIPALAAIVALISFAVSTYATFAAMDLLSRPGIAPRVWPIIIPAYVPPLIVSFALWAVLPALRARMSAGVATGVIWGSVLLVSLAIVPLSQIRYAADAEEAARLEKYAADYARLPPDAPLADLAPFLDTRNEVQREDVLARIRANPQRQAQAELMIERGDFPLGYLGRIDLDPTPALCTKARELLRQRVAPLAVRTPGAEPYAKVADEVSDALAAMKWLVGYECSCDAESRAWEDMANGYRDTNYDVVELRELRDPKALGRTLREYPARFSQLSPKSHLKAWLNYADDPALRTQALAGARTLDHRTADALEMLTDPYDSGAPWKVLMYLPALNLDATPRLCSAALARIRVEVAKTYRPKPDDPRSYDELLSRLGAGEPLVALIWLAGHGCDADLDLADAETLVRAYRDSPDRAAMLASLAQARRRP